MEDVRDGVQWTPWENAEGLPSKLFPYHQRPSSPEKFSLAAVPMEAHTDAAAFQSHTDQLTHRRKRSNSSSLRGVLLTKYRSNSTGNRASHNTAPDRLPDGSCLHGSDARSGRQNDSGQHLGGLHLNGCSLCGDEPAAWFSLDSLLEQVQDPLDGLFSGHESDESGCSASSRISQQQPAALPAPKAQSDSLNAHRSDAIDWCFPSAAAASNSLDAALPSQDVSDFSEEDLLMCLDVACQDLGVVGQQPAGSSKDPSGRSSTTALGTSAPIFLPAAVQPAVPLLRASSSNSSVGVSCSAGSTSGTGKGLSGNLPGGLRMQRMSAPHAPAAGGGGNGGQRKRGRPRRYDTTLPLLPGAMEAQAAAALAGHVNGVDSEKRKRTRGAKPKYQFLTAEEAIAHRRERNRITALASYEKRKARENALRNEIAQLEQEQTALKQLLDFVQQPTVDKGAVRVLLNRPDASICTVLKFVAAEAV